jgi:CspA family cold shock protein
MATGTVKWFNNTKGYGFINADDDTQEIFAHFSAINADGYKTLKRGQKVEFDLNNGPKGLMASNIRPCSESPER